MEQSENKQILNVENLHVSFMTYAGEIKAVRGVSMKLDRGEILAVVGESGSGKSVSAQTIMKLNPMPPAVIKEGSIMLDGIDIVATSEKQMQEIRGSKVSMIFQDPMTCLNPTMKVGKQIVEAIVTHQKISRQDAQKKMLDLLDLVQIPNAKSRSEQFPHQYSGGMRQRAMIAMALSCKPDILIADEPTTALDVTIQAQIMNLLHRIREKTGTAIILITHDLGIVAEVADRVSVMYAGKVVEEGTTVEVLKSPQHPYSRALLKSLPTVETERTERLVSIEGTPPNLLNPPAGCGFFARCDSSMKICQGKQPEYTKTSDTQKAACFLLHPDCPPDARRE